MRSLVRALAATGVLLLVASPAGADVAYQAEIDDPGTIARGTVPVRAHVTGGIANADYAAYHVGGGWSESRKVSMQKVGDGRFQAIDQPWTTTALPNGTYRLEVRVWGDVPPYDPNDPGTYARRSIDVRVDNPPPIPEGLVGSGGASTARLTWEPVATAGRSDFAGYRIFRRRGQSCGGIDGYVRVADTSAAAYTDVGLAPGRYCFRVAALRSSVVSGLIASGVSAPVRAVLRPSGGGAGFPGDPSLVTGSDDGAVPPEAPALGEGQLRVSDGDYDPGLPYGPQTITQGVEAPGNVPASTREAGFDPRRGPSLIAGGLILALAALLLRRFLASAPDR